MKNKIRVLHAVSLDHVGGVETLFSAYLNRAEDEDLEHHVLLMRGPAHPQFEAILRRKAASVHIAKYRYGMKLPRVPAGIRRRNLARIYDAVSPDITVIYNAPSDRGIWGEAARRGRVMYYEHGGAWRSHDDNVAVQLLPNAHTILCNSMAARRMLELRWGVPAGRARVHLNPLRPEVKPSRTLPKKVPSNGAVRLGIAGRLVSVKGFPIALHALSLLKDRLPHAELWIAGDGPDRKSLAALAKRLQIDAQVRFLGHVTDMTAFFDTIDLFLCPSLREPLGNVCIESAACGCPVISSHVDGLPEIVREGETGVTVRPTLPLADYARLGGDTRHAPAHVYNPESDRLSPPAAIVPEALADSVYGLLTEKPSQYSRLSSSAREAGKYFLFSVYAQNLCSLFKSVAQ